MEKKVSAPGETVAQRHSGMKKDRLSSNRETLVLSPAGLR